MSVQRQLIWSLYACWQTDEHQFKQSLYFGTERKQANNPQRSTPLHLNCKQGLKYWGVTAGILVTNYFPEIGKHFHNKRKFHYMYRTLHVSFVQCKKCGFFTPFTLPWLTVDTLQSFVLFGINNYFLSLAWMMTSHATVLYQLCFFTLQNRFYVLPEERIISLIYCALWKAGVAWWIEQP